MFFVQKMFSDCAEINLGGDVMDYTRVHINQPNKRTRTVDIIADRNAQIKINSFDN